jgi:hypothetical protein
VALQQTLAVCEVRLLSNCYRWYFGKGWVEAVPIEKMFLGRVIEDIIVFDYVCNMLRLWCDSGVGRNSECKYVEGVLDVSGGEGPPAFHSQEDCSGQEDPATRYCADYLG